MSDYTSHSFNPSAQTNETRAVLQLRIAEIITKVIGDDTIQKLFEDPNVVATEKNPNKHPEQYAGKPTGIIALDLGVVSKDVKNALLVGQAVVRAEALIKDAQEIASKVDEYKAKNEVPDGGVKHTDATFKFFGSEGDPAMLKVAQGLWLGAQMVKNNEIGAVYGEVKEPHFAGSASSVAEDLAGFMDVGAPLLAKAANVLKAEGFDDAAQKFTSLAREIEQNTPAGAHPTPAKIMSDLEMNHRFAGQALAQVLFSDRYYPDDEELIGAWKKSATLIEFSKDDGKGGAAPAAQPKPAV